MSIRFAFQFAWLFCFVLTSGTAHAQPFGEADRGQPGDAMMQSYLAQETEKLENRFPVEQPSLAEWQAKLPQWRDEYLYMLGLSPLPEKSPLNATITGTFSGEDFVVDRLHFQSRPRLYVTANLYRPIKTEPGQKLPAVLVACGHADRGANGNKTEYQFLGIWLARHGYLCLMVDTLQLGEIRATHHGTFMENRWWWHSRGYTPAGVECWNGIRAIDYLISRDDVDPQKIGVTGHSGGGAATVWIAAADERVAACVPQSGMADLEAYVPDRCVNGHCDCMFLYNTYHWPWTRIAELVAPRPMLFSNSDHDLIFPMDANDRISNRLDRAYSIFGASDRFDAFVSRGRHAYRADNRAATYRFFNTWLSGKPALVTDGERDVVEHGREMVFLIPPEKLRVFANEQDLPKDELNTRIDEHFVPIAEVNLPQSGEFESWKTELLNRLRKTVFRSLPERIPAAAHESRPGEHSEWIRTEPGIRCTLRQANRVSITDAKRLLLLVTTAPEEPATAELEALATDQCAVFQIDPRGFGDTRWTVRNPPNYVERSLALLGRTADTGRIWDVAAAARLLKERARNVPLTVAAQGPRATLAAYAALIEPEIDEVILLRPGLTHTESSSPQFLNILRTCDIPESLGLLAPRRLQLVGAESESVERVGAIYLAAGAGSSFVQTRSTKP